MFALHKIGVRRLSPGNAQDDPRDQHRGDERDDRRSTVRGGQREGQGDVVGSHVRSEASAPSTLLQEKRVDNFHGLPI